MARKFELSKSIKCALDYSSSAIGKNEGLCHGSTILDRRVAGLQRVRFALGRTHIHLGCFKFVSSRSSLVITGAMIAGVLAYKFGSEPPVSGKASRFRLRAFIISSGTPAASSSSSSAQTSTCCGTSIRRASTIAPGIVKIKTKLRSPIGRLALVNSIALTPGSLVIDIKGDTLLIHWLDVKTADPDEAASMIAGAFEEHLEKAFG